MKPCYIYVAIFIFLLKCCWNVEYLIEEMSWAIQDYIPCKGTPLLKRQKVKSLEEAAKKLYSLLLTGRNPDDMNLHEETPPNSVLKSPVYLRLLNKILNTPEDDLGSYLYKLMLCELHLDEQWVGETFIIELGRNSEAVRCVLDMLYRIALCLRNIDPQMNCPDVCRAKSLSFCVDKKNSVGICDSYSDDAIEGFEINWSNNTIYGIKRWLRTIRLDVRYPSAFFEFLRSTPFLERAVVIQKLTARFPHCPCKKFYRYDKVLDACLPGDYIGSCSGTNPCANGGICVETDLNQFKCNCAPAFRGTLCEFERNPCAEINNLCGEFRCTRRPDDLVHGYRCECPFGYYRKNPTNPRCEPMPPCGIDDKDGDTDEFVQRAKPRCLNKGRCVQDPDDPEKYICACAPGFSGAHCEIVAPAPTWSFWSAWTACFWPEVGEVCYKKPYSERTRTCMTNVPGQRCVGPRRQVRYHGCEFSSDAFDNDEKLTDFRRERLVRAHELCSYRHEDYSLPEYSAMQESVNEAFNLDDYSSAGDEEAPHLNVPKEMIEARSLGNSTATAVDLIWLGGWIYAFLIHVFIVGIWTYYIYQLRAR